MAIGAGLPFYAGAEDAPADADSEARPVEQGRPLKLSGTSTVTIKRYSDGSLVPSTRNIAFHYHHYVNLLLREQIDLEPLSPWEGEGWSAAKVRLEAFSVLPGGGRKLKYRIDERGEDAMMYRTFYVVTDHGCCDTLDGHAVHSLETGKLVMYTSGPDAPGALLEINESISPAKDREGRWVGVHTSNATFEPNVYGKQPARSVLAMVTYANQKKPLGRVLLRFPDTSRDQLVKKLEARPGSGGKDAPSVHIELLGGVTVDLPIRNDALDASTASLPPGAAAEIVPVN